jgi:hypothetical protein
MFIPPRWFATGFLLLIAPGWGCSSKGQPMKNGVPVSGSGQSTEPVRINPLNPKSTKVLPPEPDSPPPPPVNR